ncbi:MAG: hypothetical protein ACI8ZM_005375 [Crocinitomix sp.]|jgi:hypothetical protein
MSLYRKLLTSGRIVRLKTELKYILVIKQIMKRLLLLFFMLLSVNLIAQKVKVTKMSKDYFRHADVEGFYYLHDKATPEMYEWIGDIRIELDTIRPKTIKNIYKKLNIKGNKLGANAFRVIDSDIYSYGDKKFISLGIYHLRWENRDQNLSLFHGKKIYLFGFLGHHKRIGGYKVAVNGEKMLLEELRYKFIQPKVGRIVKVKLGGGLKKDAVKIEIKSNMLPRYYKFEIFKGAFNKGEISEHEWSFGELLIRILDKETHKL